MVILVLNCGSSSIKYQLLQMENASDYQLLAKGLVERIGLDVGVVNHQIPGSDKMVKESVISNHTVGIKLVLDLLTDSENGVLGSLNEIEAVGHRVAHGGEYFSNSSYIDDLAIDNIERLCELAPLHNPANLLGIRAISTLMPSAPQVAVFDTSFHQTMPDYAYTYAIPYEYYTKYKIRKYGFHGTSHKYVAQQACEKLGLDFNNSKIVTCHLGNGSSITAIKNGESIDTTMGFTPLEGMIMGTRSGDIDPGAIFYIQEKDNLSSQDLNAMLNRKSGFLGVSGVSSDARDLEKAAQEGNERAALTLQILHYRIIKFIGAYSAAMGGVDLIIFTGGIGENDKKMRQAVGEKLSYLGAHFDQSLNQNAKGDFTLLTTPESTVKMAVVATNEELVIAQDTLSIVNNLK